MSLLVSLIVLSFLIFFHELGHFLAARIMGVKVEVFSIGFGRRILVKRYGDTEYRLAMIPLGGYVRMKGQDDADPTKRSYDADSYTVKTPLQKIFILFAGQRWERRWAKSSKTLLQPKQVYWKRIRS